MVGVFQAEFRLSVPSRSSRAIATVRASRMLWAEGMRVAVSTCRFGCMFLVRGPQPRDLRFGEFLLVTGQRAQVGAVQNSPGSSCPSACGTGLTGSDQ